LEIDANIHQYNLVVTNHYMMVVLRKQPSLQSIHCNSLGYAGLLFVKNEEKLALLKSNIKPIELLSALAMPTFGVEQEL
jgi:ATP adenylyltransferase/5',5'''-P-1,P-4-tetraphosphate phosphorylase II